MRKVALRIKRDNGQTIRTNVEFNVSDVSRPTMSIAKMVDQGYDILLSQDGSWVINKHSKGKLPVRREGNIFILDYKLDAEQENETDVDEFIGVTEDDDTATYEGIPSGGDDSERLQQARDLREQGLQHLIPFDPMDDGDEYFNPRNDLTEAPRNPFTEDDNLLIETRAATAPMKPSKAEQENHNLTHIPYAPWCPLCVAARGRDSPHRSQSEAVEHEGSIIQFDYTFWTSSVDLTLLESDATATQLTAVDLDTGYKFACQCLTKGPKDSYARSAVGI